VIVVIVAIVASTGNSNASIIVAIILSLVLFLGGLVVVVWFGVKLSLVPSVLVIERVSLRRAMARSWSLTRRYFWRTFGIELLIGVMLAVASQIQTPVSVIALIFGGIANPTGESTTAVLSSLRVTEVATTIVGEAVAAITGIIQTASSALIYIDLRMRKEGLDLALMKFVDDRAAGIPDAVDPYSAPQVVTPPPVGVPVVPAETA
jgi:heme exporter protein D